MIFCAAVHDRRPRPGWWSGIRTRGGGGVLEEARPL